MSNPQPKIASMQAPAAFATRRSTAILYGLISAWITLAALPTAAHAQAATKPPALAISQEQDGAYVVDLVSHLAWPRCAEGMQWNGKACTGTPLLLDRSAAIARATEHRQTEGVNWRLPTAGELRGLIKSSLHPQGLDPRLFPPAGNEWVWSISVTVKSTSANQYNYGNIMKGRSAESGLTDALAGTAVNMVTGQVRNDVPKSTKLPVRLVLPQD